MEVVILCGGQGTRIRDVADDLPKPMIPVGGRPILWHIMKGFAHHGFRDFILCLGYKSWVIKRYFLDYHLAGVDLRLRLGSPGQLQVCGPGVAEDWRITLAETGADVMTGCRVKRIEQYITGTTFLLTYGDGVADVDLQRLVEFHQRHGKLGTLTAVQPPGRFGEVELEGSRVVEFREKPPLARGRVNGGFFVLDRCIFDRLADDPDLVFEKGPLVDLAREGELMAYLHNGFWQPMDNSRDYKYLNELWATGQAPWKCWEAPAPWGYRLSREDTTWATGTASGGTGACLSPGVPG
jgi:glucose-1-phosphate cytidylyltransferase